MFDDLITETSKREAQNSLYEIRKENSELSDRVQDASIGLEELLNQVKRSNLSVENSTDKFGIERAKKEFDKIAYLINRFCNEFSPIYEKIFSIYMMEKLSEDENNELNSYSISVNGGTTSVVPFFTSSEQVPSFQPAKTKNSVVKEPGWRKY